jgi:hypothetical protein
MKRNLKKALAYIGSGQKMAILAALVKTDERITAH